VNLTTPYLPTAVRRDTSAAGAGLCHSQLQLSVTEKGAMDTTLYLIPISETLHCNKYIFEHIITIFSACNYLARSANLPKGLYILGLFLPEN